MANRFRLIVIFGAVSLFFATLEYLLPKPGVPFFRIGLANLPLLLAIPLLRFRDLAQLFLIKVVGQGLLGGTLTSYVFLFSTAGTLASFLAMYGAWRLAGARIGWVGLAGLGALASNAVQVWFSITLVFGQTAWVIVPVFLSLGFVAGLLVGFAALVFARQSSWYSGLLSAFPPLGPLPPGSGRTIAETEAKLDLGEPKPRRRWWRWQLSQRFDFMARLRLPRWEMIFGLICLPAVLLQSNLVAKACLMVFWAILALTAGKRLQPLYFLQLTISIVIFNLLAPAGLILFKVVGFPVTLEALVYGLGKAASLLGLVFLSLATVRKDVVLPGRFGKLVAQVFGAYEELLANRSLIRRDRLIDSVDGVLRNLEATVGEESEEKRRTVQPSGPKDPVHVILIIFMILSVLVHYSLLFLVGRN